ncbi:MAG: DUF99 family protein [Polyangiaceae bacterium]
MRRISNVLGVDDAPFPRSFRGDVPILGAVCTRTRLDGVLVSRVRRDGRNATVRIAEMLEASDANEHVQAVLLEGIALAGFNVVDIHALAERLQRPVVVFSKRKPDYPAVKRALMQRVPGGAQKWQLILRAGEMQRIDDLWVQCSGIERGAVSALLQTTRREARLPEAVRYAHLIAGSHAV